MFIKSPIRGKVISRWKVIKRKFNWIKICSHEYLTSIRYMWAALQTRKIKFMSNNKIMKCNSAKSTTSFSSNVKSAYNNDTHIGTSFASTAKPKYDLHNQFTKCNIELDMWWLIGARGPLSRASVCKAINSRLITIATAAAAAPAPSPRPLPT